MEDKYESRIRVYKPVNYDKKEVNRRLGLYYPKWVEMLEEYISNYNSKEWIFDYLLLLTYWYAICKSSLI